MQILLSPHNDDETLFTAFTAMREKPKIVVCFDSYIQPNRGEVGCSADERWAESQAAAKILGCDIERLGIRDDQPPKESTQYLINGLSPFSGKVDRVYAPARQGGNGHHDLVNYVATLCFTTRVVEYTTYTKNELYTTGNHEVVPTQQEMLTKHQALDCYQSQWRINAPHFAAVMGRSEWQFRRGKKTLHLGCGGNLIQGWVNLDIQPGADAQADVLKGIPYDDHSFDYVISEDFLEHLPPEKRVFIINEIWRVLEPGGYMEHFVPNAGSRNDFGSPSHLSHWNGQIFEHFDINSYRWEKDRHHEGIVCRFTKEFSRLINWKVEEDGVNRAQCLHVKYRAVK